MKNAFGTKATATGLFSLTIAGVVVVVVGIVVVVVVVVVGGVVVGGGGAVVAANDKCWEKNIQQLCF